MQPDRRIVPVDGSTLRARLRHILWIGGASGAGKSTIAGRLADERGLRLYSTDDVMSDHAGRSTPGRCPYLTEFMAMDMDERWVNRSPDTMLETFHWFRGEGFDQIVADLLRLPTEPGVIVEGFRLLPRLVQPLVHAPGRAVWLLPTPEFRRAASRNKGAAWNFLDETSDPERAMHNLLERDRMFTDRLRVETRDAEMAAIEVDTTMTEDELAALVGRALGL